MRVERTFTESVAGLDDGTVGTQQDLVRAGAGLQGTLLERGCRDDRPPRPRVNPAGAGIEADDGDTAAVGGGLLSRRRACDDERQSRRAAIRVRA